MKKGGFFGHVTICREAVFYKKGYRRYEIMGKTVKWGVLGTADIAKRCTIPALKMAEGCELYGIAGRNPEKVDLYKETFGFEKAYYSLDSMLDDPEIEAVYIPLPNTLHKEWVIKAAQKGKHVLCEKPLSGNVKDVQEMIETCDKAGVKFMEAFAYLHSPIIREVQEQIAAGAIGELSFMESVFFTPGYTPENIRVRRETLGGSVYDLGCYCLSMILSLVKEEPTEVMAMASYTDVKIDDFASAHLRFANGFRASLMSGMFPAQRADRIIIYGTEGTLDAPVAFNQCGDLSYKIIKGNKEEVFHVHVPDNYKLEFEQMNRCINGEETPWVSHEFSLLVSKTMDRILEKMGY